MALNWLSLAFDSAINFLDLVDVFVHPTVGKVVGDFESVEAGRTKLVSADETLRGCLGGHVFVGEDRWQVHGFLTFAVGQSGMCKCSLEVGLQHPRLNVTLEETFCDSCFVNISIDHN